ncbi:transposase [Rapidithrix thailandica]|uniref:Transposase n=1 Tax=Rapidithrix thailandica TaxID=413964 RepID=A0AAW9SG56_9BACT
MPCAGSCWQPKGQQVLLPAKRQGYTVLGALNVKGQSFYGRIVEGAVNAHIVVDILSKVSKAITKKTVVVLDNAPAHRAKIVEEHLAMWRKRGLYLQFLPAYSPELNLIEILWKQMKHFWAAPRWIRPQDYSSKTTLYNRVKDIFENYGSKYTIFFW